mmetsp:Transcript_25128/g.40807  ORF Transcript_25128/g.40807 Transcript_25128/m.40807 type:complete len:234 (+) Transcript_25128:156-857(+)
MRNHIQFLIHIHIVFHINIIRLFCITFILILLLLLLFQSSLVLQLVWYHFHVRLIDEFIVFHVVCVIAKQPIGRGRISTIVHWQHVVAIHWVDATNLAECLNQIEFEVLVRQIVVVGVGDPRRQQLRHIHTVHFAVLVKEFSAHAICRPIPVFTAVQFPVPRVDIHGHALHKTINLLQIVLDKTRRVHIGSDQHHMTHINHIGFLLLQQLKRTHQNITASAMSNKIDTLKQRP